MSARRRCFALAAAVLSLAAAADPCPDAMTQADLNTCAAATHARADRRLNEAYAALRGELGAAEQKRLKAAQQAWLKLRDLDCAYQAGRSEGGSSHGMEVGFCRATLSEARADQLERWHRALSEPQ